MKGFIKHFCSSLLILFTAGMIACGGGGGGGGEGPTVTPDNTAPYVVSVSPGNNINIPVNQSFTITFNESMKSDTINNSSFVIIDNLMNPVGGSVQYNNGTAILTLDNSLDYSASYTLVVTTDAKDIAGNNLSSIYSFNFTTVAMPAPSIKIKQGINPIENGGQGYDFGDKVIAGSYEVIFTILNEGSADLSINTVGMAGTGISSYQLDSVDSYTVQGGESTTFKATFKPSTTGSKQIEITIGSNDPNVSSYSFTIAGNGIPIPVPEITITKDLTTITNNMNNAHDYGNVTVGNEVTVTFKITNTGTADLQLNGTIVVESSNSDIFKITQPDNTQLSQGQDVTFKITFSPQIAGSYSSTITITNNDDDNNPFIFTVQGAGGSAPTLTTDTISSITETTAISGGNITSDGDSPVTARGVCWSTSQNPTIANNKTTDGTGTGAFTSNITGLTSNTTYYVRAYATNNVSTAYGEEISFTTTKSSNAFLSGITFTSTSGQDSSSTFTYNGAMTPAVFDPAILDYSCSIICDHPMSWDGTSILYTANPVQSVILNLTSASTHAVIQVSFNGTTSTVTSGTNINFSTSSTFGAITVGSNLITITVTAENQVTSKVYHISITGVERFTIYDANTIIDNKTNYWWQRILPTTKSTWQNAVNYCAGLTNSGYDDWKLPSQDELRTLYTAIVPSLRYVEYFQHYGFTLAANNPQYLWTSTDYSTYTTIAIIHTMTSGPTEWGNFSKSNANACPWAVRVPE